jgi:hypothetical protein
VPVRDVVQRAALLLGSGQEREADLRLVGDPAALLLLAAEAHARPAQVKRGGGRHAPARGLPGAQHRARLDPADVVRRGRPVAVEAGGHVALVGIAVDVDDFLATADLRCPAHALLEHARRRTVVVGVVVLERRLRDRAVIGEVGPRADRDPHALAAAADDLVDAQHVDRRVDGVGVAARIVGLTALTAVLDDPVVGQVRLDRPVAREAHDAVRPPAGARGSEVAVRADDRLLDLLEDEAVELRVGRLRVEEAEERGRVGGGLQTGRRGVERGEVGVAAGTRVRVRRRHDDVLLGEPARAKPVTDLLDHPARDHEQVDGDEGHLAPVALEHDRAREQARVLPLADAVRASPPAQVVARARGDVGLAGAGGQVSCRCRWGEAQRHGGEDSERKSKATHARHSAGTPNCARH